MAVLGNTKAISLTLLDGVIGDLNPKTTNVYSLGTSALKWKNIYVTSTDAGTLTAGNTSIGGNLTVAGTSQFNGVVKFANNTWNTVGDDAQMGDINKAGHIGIQGLNGNTGIFFTQYNQSTKTVGGSISYNGTNFVFDKSIIPSANNTYTLGSSSNHWSQIFGHQLVIQGTTNATMTAASANPRITFQEGTGTQPVHLVYTDQDSYRQPAGLKIVGGTSATPAWLEVEGNIYGTLKGNADTATALASNAGSLTQPIYFADGKPAATTYALKATVNNATQWGVSYYSTTTNITSTAAGTTSQFLGGNGSAAPAWRDASYIINTLTTGASDPTDADYYVAQYAGGGTSTTSYHRRPHSALWNYINGKITANRIASSTTYGVAYFTSATKIGSTAAGTAGYPLIGAGSAAPTWYGGQVNTGTAAASWKTTFNGTTASTTTATGAVVISGGLGVGNRVTASEINATRPMVVSAGKVYSNISGSNVLLPAKTSMLFSDGVAFASPGLTAANDVGWIRMLGTSESDGVLEIATGDDGGTATGEAIVARQYNTSNVITHEATLLAKQTGATSFPVSVTTPIVKATGTTNSTSSTTGTLIVSGGVGIANDIFSGGRIFDMTGARIQYVTLLPQTAGAFAAGWRRCCKVSGNAYYGNFLIELTGGFNTGAPTMATIAVVLRNKGANMKILHVGYTGNIQKIRLVHDSSNTDTYWLDVYIGAWTANTTLSRQVGTFIGNVKISDINATLTDAPSDAVATAELDLTTGASVNVYNGTAGTIAYYSDTNKIQSHPKIQTTGGHLFLAGSNASSSTANTTQIVFGTSASQHVALSANTSALIINPTTSSTTGQIILSTSGVSTFNGGGITANGVITAQANIAAGPNSQLLTLKNNRPAANIAANQWFWGSDFLVPNTVDNTNMCHVFGKANSNKNSGVINFHYAGNASDNNYTGLGVYGVEDSLKVFANGNITILKGNIWIQGGSNAGGNVNRMALSAGMPTGLQYNSSQRGVRIWSNAIAFADPYNGNTNNDSGWIRHIEETGNTGIFEIAVGDDGNEPIYVRQYNTSSAIKNEAILLSSTGATSFPISMTTPIVIATDTTDSISAATGAIKVSGGIGVAKNIWSNGFIKSGGFTSDTTVTSSVFKPAITLYPSNSNEINFGGYYTGNRNIYFGYRKINDREIPTTYHFGPYGQVILTVGEVAAGTTKETYITLGNNKATSEANNGRGRVRMYGTNAYCSDIIPVDQTANRSYYLTKSPVADAYLLSYHVSNGDLNAIYGAGIFTGTGSATNGLDGSGKYYAIISVPYNDAGGNTHPYWGWQIGTTTGDNDGLFFRLSNSTAWRDWRQIVHIAKDTGLGSATKPVYVANTGAITECSTYAGGTAVTLNNASKAASTASFYAPTAGGANNTQALVGAGTTTAPKWVDISPSCAWTAGTTAGPSLKVTVLGQTQSTGAVIPSASASASGIVTTGAQTFAGAKTFNDNVTIGTTTAGALGIAQTNGLGLGISLYGGPKAAGAIEYGLFFGKTATFGTLGDVSGDWATYFTMNRNDTRGWIFKSNGGAANGNNNVASISGRGHFTGTLTPSSWIDGQKTMVAAYNIADYSNTSSYNPWIRATNTWSNGAESAKKGTIFSFGTLGTKFYWIGSDSARTANEYDNGLQFDVLNGQMIIESVNPKNYGSLHITSRTSVAANTTTVNGDTPWAGIRMTCYSTTTTRNSAYGDIRVYNNNVDDGTGVSYNSTMLIQGCGDLYLGGGEAPHNVLVAKGITNGESTYIVSDGSIWLEANAGTAANRCGVVISTAGHVYPQKAEANNSGAQDLGQANSRWATIYGNNIWAGNHTDNTSESVAYRCGTRGGAGTAYLFSQPDHSSGGFGIYATNAANQEAGYLWWTQERNMTLRVINNLTFNIGGMILNGNTYGTSLPTSNLVVGRLFFLIQS